jgi:hypothetical protein
MTATRANDERPPSSGEAQMPFKYQYDLKVLKQSIPTTQLGDPTRVQLQLLLAIAERLERAVEMLELQAIRSSGGGGSV